ncbi:proline-rich extensin-like protein EPR1 [Colias croceus]|uniref:proline-rich extensin-like protein EPR1 n=1 Tax=Colias crocea TaxID=72248 RepID=UPI001E2807A2|nr:proline-rich extensin-like protein EPR1 [Colias croceus]
MYYFKFVFVLLLFEPQSIFSHTIAKPEDQSAHDRRKREINDVNIPAAPTLPDLNLNELPSDVRKIYENSPDFAKFFGGSDDNDDSAVPKENNNEIPPAPKIVEQRPDEEEPADSAITSVIVAKPAVKSTEEENVPIHHTNVIVQQPVIIEPPNLVNVIKNSNEDDSNSKPFVNNANSGEPLDDFKNKAIAMFNKMPNKEEKPKTYGMDLVGNKGVVWNDLDETPVGTDNVGVPSVNTYKPQETEENNKTSKNIIYEYPKESDSAIPVVTKEVTQRPVVVYVDKVPESKKPVEIDSVVEPSQPVVIEPKPEPINYVVEKPEPDYNSYENTIVKPKNNEPDSNVLKQSFDNLLKQIPPVKPFRPQAVYKPKVEAQPVIIEPKPEPINYVVEKPKPDYNSYENTIVKPKNNEPDSNVLKQSFDNLLKQIPPVKPFRPQAVYKPKVEAQPVIIEAKPEPINYVVEKPKPDYNSYENTIDKSKNNEPNSNVLKQSFDNLLKQIPPFKPFKPQAVYKPKVQNRPSYVKPAPTNNVIIVPVQPEHQNTYVYKPRKESHPIVYHRATRKPYKPTYIVKPHYTHERKPVKKYRERSHKPMYDEDKLRRSFANLNNQLNNMQSKSKPVQELPGTYGMNLHNDKGYMWNDLNPPQDTVVNFGEGEPKNKPAHEGNYVAPESTEATEPTSQSAEPNSSAESQSNEQPSSSNQQPSSSNEQPSEAHKKPSPSYGKPSHPHKRPSHTSEATKNPATEKPKEEHRQPEKHYPTKHKQEHQKPTEKPKESKHEPTKKEKPENQEKNPQVHIILK